jgi:Tol biopolymer transport system component
MLCPYCKNEHPDQTDFCPITGQPLPALPNIPPSTCANCGASLPVDAKICLVCGTSNKHARTPVQAGLIALWLKSRDYIKLACFSFAALLIFSALLFFVLRIMLARIGPPFTETQPPAVTPSMESIHQQLTKTMSNPSHTPSLTPSITPSMSVPSQTQPATITLTQSWKQGILVYLVRIPSGFNSIYMMNLEKESEPQLLLQPTTNQHYYGPWLSPDSKKVVFYDLNGSNGILDLGDLSVKLIEGCNSPTFSPSGAQILCGGNGKFRILNAENGALIRTLDVGVNGWLPVFSPDGMEVVFAVFGDGRSTSIWRTGATGGQKVSLASKPFENYCPVWSPDGNWIAYQSSAVSGRSEIWIIDRNGENKRQITTTPGGWSRGPVWSPDGKWLAFVANRSGGPGIEYGDVFVISLDTGEIHQVTNTGGAVDNWRVTWGPIR